MFNQTSNDRTPTHSELMSPIDYNEKETYNGVLYRDFELDREIERVKDKNVELYAFRYEHKLDLYTGQPLFDDGFSNLPSQEII